MTDIAIRVENLSKQYRIGGPQARYKTIRESLNEAVGAPFRRLSSVVRGQSSAVANETIWALKDVSFEVKRGEVVGIPSAMLRASIGRNGAGKNRDRETRGWGDKEQGGVSPCRPLSPSPPLLVSVWWTGVGQIGTGQERPEKIVLLECRPVCSPHLRRHL